MTSTSSCLAPEEEFPTALRELTVLEIHVLHSRICRQLDHEYLTDPAGAHPATLDRLREIRGALATRDAACPHRAPPGDSNLFGAVRQDS